MKFFVCIAAALLSLLMVAHAPVQDWTKEEAIQEFQVIFDQAPASKGQRPDFEKMKARSLRFNEWIDRVEAAGVDLGEMEILVPIARYIGGFATSDPVKARKIAGEELVNIFFKRGNIPQAMKPFEPLLGRVMGVQIGVSLEADDYDRLDKLIEIYFDFAGPQYAYFTSLGKKLLDRNTEESKAFLAKLLSRAMSSKELTAEEKSNILRYIYGASSGDSSVATVNFVPFKATTMEGEEIAVEDFKGKVLLIDFWATWCGPCIREMPHVVEAYRKYKDRGLEIIGVSLDQPNAEEKIRAMEKKLGMTWQQIYDGGFYDARVARMNNINAIPETFLLDRSGRPRYQGLRGAQMHEKIEELLNEKPAAQTREPSPGRR